MKMNCNLFQADFFPGTFSSLWSKVVLSEVVRDVKRKFCIKPLKRQPNHLNFDCSFLLKYVEGKADIINVKISFRKGSSYS